MLDPAYYDAWLDPATPKNYLEDILSHDIDGQLQFNRVGREVNLTVINKQPNDHPALSGRSIPYERRTDQAGRRHGASSTRPRPGFRPHM
ncbi:hypothetical protein [Mesorhizobium huakuii]|uniref:SOS response-associated peptidase n=1 Tax=Mesorhizobium huakuii TaxID=28104 RepID=A0ABZ0VSF1_9HYPH|nr:hypothetical protein [Mesorhizobium huakuii]WQB99209.1 hypothetical protein U0R22_003384 [Mesorhizobium huakuii]